MENRVTKVRKNIGSISWRLIPGQWNSADIATRECSLKGVTAIIVSWSRIFKIRA